MTETCVHGALIISLLSLIDSSTFSRDSLQMYKHSSQTCSSLKLALHYWLPFKLFSIPQFQKKTHGRLKWITKMNQNILIYTKYTALYTPHSFSKRDSCIWCLNVVVFLSLFWCDRESHHHFHKIIWWPAVEESVLRCLSSFICYPSVEPQRWYLIGQEWSGI